MLIRDLRQLPEELRGATVAIGNFDGVHRGHASIIERLTALARRLGGPSLIFTFDPHPARVLRPEVAPIPLTTTERKAALLADLGVDATLAYPTDRTLLEYDAARFFSRILCEGLSARGVVEGPDFRFGRGRQGDIALLGQLCQQTGMQLEVVTPTTLDGQVVSSSRVRAAIAEGRIDEALHLLTRPYRIAGIVVHGSARGRTLGFPTANVERIATLLPSEGIYAGRAWVDGVSWPAAISLGPNPTFGEGALKVEVYLIGFDGDLYDRPLEVDFLARLRNIERFNSVGTLIAEMERDVAATRRLVAAYEKET